MSSKSPQIDQQAAKRLLLVRQHLGLNQEEMAELCDLSQGMVSYIEKGKREIPQNVFKILFIRKNISPVYILAGVGPIEYKKIKADYDLQDLKTEIEIIKGQLEKLIKEKA